MTDMPSEPLTHRDIASGSVDFIDFGCGPGRSLPLVQSLSGGQGLGIDISEQAVDECRRAGFSAELGDLREYSIRNAATGTFAIDLLPEIGDRLDFEQAVSRLILAARNYAVIQHNFFDADAMLAPLGLQIEANFNKRIRCKPGMADYISLLGRLTPSHSVSGFAIFGLGQARITPQALGAEAQGAEAQGAEAQGAEARGAEALPGQVPVAHVAGAFRSMRVVIGRKEQARFRAALRRMRVGEQLFLWEARE